MKTPFIVAMLLLLSSEGGFPALSIGASLDSTLQTTQPAYDSDRIVATVNSLPIKDAELNAHAAATRLPREEALEDLIDLTLLRRAAAANNISMPGTLTRELRDGVELALAQALGIDIPQPRITLVVDHAWLKDADDDKGRKAGRLLLEKLRHLVENGATIADAYAQLQVSGNLWHIGDHEEYLTLILPTPIQALAPGSLSQIVSGDGGLHLFKVYQRKQEPLPRDDVRVPLLARLRVDADIERPEPLAR
jgi:hypothetical protein